MPDRFFVRRTVRITCWLLATLCGVLLFLQTSRHGSQSQVTYCLFRHVAGIPCPLCGMTRAGLALIRGEWSEMFRLHPLAPILALECAGVWLLSGAWAAGWQLPLPQSRIERLVERSLLTNAALLILLWGARFYLGTLPG